MFIITITKLMNLNHERDEYLPWEGGHEPPENITPQTSIVVCADAFEAVDAVKKAIDSDDTWQIFEVVAGKSEPRSVKFEGDVIEIV